MMHHRSIGKRIRMDEPPPPEYDTTNPMTPMTPMESDIQEPYTPYGANYNPASTPVHNRYWSMIIEIIYLHFYYANNNL